jgi:hypothetical protein
MKARYFNYLGLNETLFSVSHFPELRELPFLIEISATIAVLQIYCLSPDYPTGRMN